MISPRDFFFYFFKNLIVSAIRAVKVEKGVANEK